MSEQILGREEQKVAREYSEGAPAYLQILNMTFEQYLERLPESAPPESISYDRFLELQLRANALFREYGMYHNGAARAGSRYFTARHLTRR